MEFDQHDSSEAEAADVSAKDFNLSTKRTSRSEDKTFTQHTDSESNDISSGEAEEHDLIDSKVFHEQRWKRLRNSYRDEYLDLFKATFSAEDEGENDVSAFHGGRLHESQIGAVTWTAIEKAQFFSALARKGRRNMLGIQAEVPSKSILEITDYLQVLREAEADRQRFESDHKNISHLQIPAAIEVGRDCEGALDRAAEALAAFQDNYDYAAAASREAGSSWVIDRHVAAKLDEQNDEVEEEAESSAILHDEQVEEQSNSSASMFHVSTLLQLSERLFMNMPETCEHEHWSKIAEPGQHPSLTAEVLVEFQNMVTNLTRRVLQSAMFLAKSRIRSGRSTGYAPASLLTSQDVHAALDVLQMAHDSWNFWKLFARRSGVTVVLGGHDKGEGAGQRLSLTQIENALSVRKSLRRRRSLSSLAGISSASDAELTDSIEEAETVPETSLVIPSVEDGERSESDTSESADELSETPSSNVAEPGINPRRFINRQQRRILVEQAQDEYMETLDRQAQQREEQVLWSVLNSTPIKLEKGQILGKRPRTLRKTKEELHHWTDNVSRMAQWERDGGLVSDDAFPLSNKRQKLDEEA